jgi:xanthine dehydrogenase accessory factor
MANDPILDQARELNAAGTAFALVTVVRAIAPTSAWVGAQAIVLADGTLHGWIGGGCAKDVVIGTAQNAIRAGQPRLVRISNDALLPETDVEQFAMACASNGTIELFIQPHGAQRELCVLGNTPAADEARFLAQRLRIGLAETPAQATVVLVATQGEGDEEALEAALRSRATRVLMIASPRKADRLRSVMCRRGIDETQLARLQAPAGPDAGAKTPQEIALVAITGVLAEMRGRETSGGASKAPAVGPAKAPALPTPEASFVNPVCGMAVSLANPKHVETYEGVAYYFCCDGCLVTFRQEPAKYAAIHLRA